MLSVETKLTPLVLALPECTSCANSAIGSSLKHLNGKEAITFVYPSSNSKAEWAKLYPAVASMPYILRKDISFQPSSPLPTPCLIETKGGKVISATGFMNEITTKLEKVK